MEGGLGSQVMGVPTAEQRIQGTTISAFYSANKVNKRLSHVARFASFL
ncbi:MAG: hypothetical protein HOY79_19350 [Streptomyces sp.]|nr:hypothetical protein [Streptomyces sp.]